jgi:hypothetical protein
MRKKPVFLLISLIYTASLFYFRQWENVFYRSDSWGYYLHLPSILLYSDAGDYSESIAAWRQYNSIETDPRADAYGLRPSPNGRSVNKYPVGVATMQIPFFAAAHIFCKVTGAAAADGFSKPYVLLAGLSTLFFSLWGLFLLEKSLRQYFSPTIVLTATATVALATNLFFFGTYTVGMAHPYLFFLFALLIRATQQWYERPNVRSSALIGLSLGFIAMCRLPEVIAVLIPLFWANADDTRFSLWKKNGRMLGLAALVFFITLLPQFIWWKWVSGQWLYYSYQGEQFHWSNPQILNGLLSFQNGWLVYTPVMILSLAGIFWLRQFAKPAFWPLVLLLPLHVYIIYSWWCWQYINGFGSRPMVEVYPLLAFPLAAFIAYVWKKIWSRWVLLVALVAFSALNLFQTWQISRLILISEHANRAYFLEIFGKTSRSRSAFIAYETKEKQPGESKIFKIKTLYFNEIKDSTEEHHSRKKSLSAPFGFRCAGEFCFTGVAATDTSGILPGDWLRVSVRAFVSPEEYERRIDRLALLVLAMSASDGQMAHYRSITVASKIGNPENVLWSGGKAGEWGEAAFFTQVPPDYRSGGNLKIYIWNPQGQKLWLDDLRLELWRR